MNADDQRMHLRITGRVQGVCFRLDCRDRAARLGLHGWVRNLPDGRVEVMAEGAPVSLGRLLAWCREGPPGARVLAVDETYGAATGEFSGFGIRT